jgi:hypothetical protein
VAPFAPSVLLETIGRLDFWHFFLCSLVGATGAALFKRGLSDAYAKAGMEDKVK